MEEFIEDLNPKISTDNRRYPFTNKYSNMLRYIATGMLILSVISGIVIWSELGTIEVMGYYSSRTEAYPLGIVMGFVAIAQGIFLFILLNAVAYIGDDVANIRNSVYDKNKEDLIKSHKNAEEYNHILKFIELKVKQDGECSLRDVHITFKDDMNKQKTEHYNPLENEIRTEKLKHLDIFFENDLESVLKEKGYKIERVQLEKSNQIIEDKIVKLK